MIIFELSMPNIGSWDRKWSGESRVYIIAKPNRVVPEEIIGNSFYYDFGDGWGASISVSKMSNLDAKKIMNRSEGFEGYDWMVDSIIENRRIISPS